LKGQGHIHINGLYRHGFLIAPAILDAALGLMAGNHEVAQSLGIRVVQEKQA
jgi:glycine oxidase